MKDLIYFLIFNVFFLLSVFFITYTLYNHIKKNKNKKV